LEKGRRLLKKDLLAFLKRPPPLVEEAAAFSMKGGVLFIQRLLPFHRKKMSF
jgi:hypothetical protein